MKKSTYQRKIRDIISKAIPGSKVTVTRNKFGRMVEVPSKKSVKRAKRKKALTEKMKRGYRP